MVSAPAVFLTEPAVVIEVCLFSLLDHTMVSRAKTYLGKSIYKLRLALAVVAVASLLTSQTSHHQNLVEM